MALVSCAAWIVPLASQGGVLSDTSIPTQETLKQGCKRVFMASMGSSASNTTRVNLSPLRLSASLNDSSLWIFHWDDVQHPLF